MLLARSAHASDPVAAQALFDEARTLMNDQRFAEACPKLEESQRLDPAGGTLLHLGLCYEGLDKTASAWAAFNEALSAAVRDGRRDRERIARQRLSELEPKLTRVVVHVHPSTANLSGLRVTRGEVDVTTAQLGTPIPVDPGRHVFSAVAPGRERWTHEIVAPAGPATLEVQIPELAEEATPPAPRDGTAQKTLGLVAAGVGLGGLAVGSIFGLRALSKKEDAEPHCRGDLCDGTGLALRDEGMRAGDLSTLFFVGGGVLLAGGALLFLSAPSGSGRSVSVDLGPARIGIAGRW